MGIGSAREGAIDRRDAGCGDSASGCRFLLHFGLNQLLDGHRIGIRAHHLDELLLRRGGGRRRWKTASGSLNVWMAGEKKGVRWRTTIFGDGIISLHCFVFQSLLLLLSLIQNHLDRQRGRGGRGRRRRSFLFVEDFYNFVIDDLGVTGQLPLDDVLRSKWRDRNGRRERENVAGEERFQVKRRWRKAEKVKKENANEDEKRRKERRKRGRGRRGRRKRRGKIRRRRRWDGDSCMLRRTCSPVIKACRKDIL